MLLPTSDNISLGNDVVGKIYLGSDIVYSPAGGTGKGTLYSSTSISASAVVKYGGSASLTSTSTLFGRALPNPTLEIDMVSTSDPVLFAGFVAVGGTVQSIETSPDNWKLYAYDTITHIQWYDGSYGYNDPTSVHVINGDTLTSLNTSFRALRNITSFTWDGDLNPLVTDLSYAWAYCDNIVTFIFNCDMSNVEDFSYTWFSCSSLEVMPVIDTSSGTNFHATWKSCESIVNFPTLDLSSGVDFNTTFYAMTALESLPVLNTTNGQDFTGFANWSTSLICIGGIDTRNQTATANMFTYAVSLIAPNTTDQDTIVAGALWTNPNPCPYAYAPPIYNMTEVLIDG